MAASSTQPQSPSAASSTQLQSRSAASVVTALDPRRWRALALLAVAQFVVVLDASIMNIAPARAARERVAAALLLGEQAARAGGGSRPTLPTSPANAPRPTCPTVPRQRGGWLTAPA
jgi:hypothetical protein